ncbi:MAG TPA: hypothetical protein PLN06_00550 [Bacteroidales bacterium]|nr:hypothetical protein [Bacteroidales bacterium]HCI56354.1 hypothetical protein [Bacteroidales bacterium]HOU95100.1 hypothetical protein [Bacteroidales bacterium]HQG36410.1 hypothetical protein [Bacteroidales bacterium]HQG53416.1 hypothetical protein [Bacteroidales bacterium]
MSLPLKGVSLFIERMENQFYLILAIGILAVFVVRKAKKQHAGHKENISKKEDDYYEPYSNK